MSKKRQQLRAKHDEKVKKQGEKVIMAIFGGLIAMAILFILLVAGGLL